MKDIESDNFTEYKLLQWKYINFALWEVML